SLIGPRHLIVEYSEVPKVSGPPMPREGRSGAAPGRLVTPEFGSVEAEVNRAKAFFPASLALPLELVHGDNGKPVGPGSEGALTAFLKSLGVGDELRALASNPPADRRQHFNPDERQKRQVQELVNHIQRLLQLSERVRDEFFWHKAKANDWVAATKEYKTYFWDEVIGRFPPASLPANPRTRKILDKPKWTGYEVALDVWPDVFSWGILLVPKDLKP